jgi:hypothetical protein
LFTSLETDVPPLLKGPRNTSDSYLKTSLTAEEEDSVELGAGKAQNAVDSGALRKNKRHTEKIALKCGKYKRELHFLTRNSEINLQ